MGIKQSKQQNASHHRNKEFDFTDVKFTCIYQGDCYPEIIIITIWDMELSFQKNEYINSNDIPEKSIPIRRILNTQSDKTKVTLMNELLTMIVKIQGNRALDDSLSTFFSGILILFCRELNRQKT